VTAKIAISRDLDASLVEAFAEASRGNPRSFDDLVRHTSPRLYRLAVRITASFEDAEDILQEAYARMVASFRLTRFMDATSLEAWLYRVVANGALRLLRGRRRARAFAEQAGPQIADPARAEQRAELAILASWLEELPQEQRIALVLKELEGLSTAEVASVLETSEGAVEQRLVRARATLRARYSHG
jgi:RNA polymerase sigma-70 factor, ECF subfamily